LIRDYTSSQKTENETNKLLNQISLKKNADANSNVQKMLDLSINTATMKPRLKRISNV